MISSTSSFPKFKSISRISSNVTLLENCDTIRHQLEKREQKRTFLEAAGLQNICYFTRKITLTSHFTFISNSRSALISKVWVMSHGLEPLEAGQWNQRSNSFCVYLLHSKSLRSLRFTPGESTFHFSMGR